MSSEQVTQPFYPYNLLLAAKGQTDLELPVSQSADVQAGLRYALSTLTEVEQELVRLHYAQGRSLADAAAQLSLSQEEARACGGKLLQKLRIPSRWNYIRYGVAGYLKKEQASQYNKGYLAGFEDGYQDGRRGADRKQDGALGLPIEALNLSTGAYNCLNRMGYVYIGEVAALSEYSIRVMHGLGRKYADEVARALQDKGIGRTAWYQFLI